MTRRGGTILIYGRTGIGKTLDAFHCFERAWGIVTERGALDSVSANLGREPKHFELIAPDDPYRAMLDTINKQITPRVQTGEITSLILDSGTAWAEGLLMTAVSKAGDSRQGYTKFATQLRRTMDKLLALPIWIVTLWHEEESESTSDGFFRGGPACGWRKLRQPIAGKFSAVYRAAVVNGKRVYQCDGTDAMWIQKCRYGAAAKEQPLDLRPILWRIMAGDKPMPEFAPKPIRMAENSGGGGLL